MHLEARTKREDAELSRTDPVQGFTALEPPSIPATSKENAAPTAIGNGIGNYKNSTVQTYPSATQNARGSGRRARIQQALRNANELGLITDAEYGTAAMMASYIKDDFDHPLCAVEVQRIARDRGRDERTIRRHVLSLARIGFVEDRTAGNGLRGVFCGRRVIFGIDFSPLVDQYERLRLDLKAKREEEGRILAMRRTISFLRRRLRAACEEISDDGLLDWLASLPRRYGSLSADELARLVEECQRRLEGLVRQRAKMAASVADRPNSGKESEKSAVGRSKMSDGPDKIARPSTSTKKENNNREESTRYAVDISAPAVGTTGTITLEKALAATPGEWREWIAIYREGGMDAVRAFNLTAKQFFNQAGGSERIWRFAASRAGENMAALLALIACESPNIREIDAWMAAMVGRACREEFNWQTPFARLTRTNREAVPC
ncbi:replication protein C-like [Mesorhizobium sp. J18]|uniref:helix-turn-helix domain-containing protein n=1 Tax=Mesorhizobium sp. J18 TaxID=935263 RepID=UPI00119AF8B7|nr:helix-turn-helix domain-containing protein [Mesorhizobium sp. J18]TWG96317.1 replication protein C-like [Mesorhizobium sp. J18]